MRYRMLKSRTHLLQIIFGGAVFVLLGTLRAADSNTSPLATEPLPAPDTNIVLTVAFSSTSGRMAVSAGSDGELSSLYVNSPDNPQNFTVYWSPNTEVHGVGSMAWSHNEAALAFIGMSGSRTTKTAEVWLYILDIASGEVRNVLKIVEEINGEEHRLVNVHEERAVLAWLGNNKVCMPTRDNSIIAVDCNDGHIETLVPAQDCKIWGPVSVSPDKLRFLKMRPSGEGREVEVCDFNGSEVTSCGIIPINSEKTFSEGLSADGKYVIIMMPMLGKTSIFDVSQMALVKEIPLRVESDTENYFYLPIAVLEGGQLVLFEVTDNKNSTQPMSRRRLCTLKL